MDNDKVDKDVHDIKNTLTKLGMRLEIVYNCLVGNEILKDGGLVADISIIRAELVQLVKRIDIVEKTERQRNIYVRILWAVGGVLITIIITRYLK